MTYGPNPWQQTQWDWRAAANFICGGAGSGLIVLAAVSGAAATSLTALLLGGLALMGVGLSCVWLEIGRPWRALNVLFNPRTSWMTREALVWALLLPVALAGATGLAGFAWGAALLALVFVYCQGRMLNAAKGIPAWREPLLLPLVLLTGLAEGSGLLLLAQPGRMAGQPLLLALIAVLLVARAAQWLAYRRRLQAGVAAPALRALEGAGRWLLPVGCVVPLLLLGLVLAGAGGPAPAAPMLIAAGVLAGAPGAWFKFVLITRAGFNQGFALKHLPVRGVSRGAF